MVKTPSSPVDVVAPCVYDYCLGIDLTLTCRLVDLLHDATLTSNPPTGDTKVKLPFDIWIKVLEYLPDLPEGRNDLKSLRSVLNDRDLQEAILEKLCETLEERAGSGKHKVREAASGNERIEAYVKHLLVKDPANFWDGGEDDVLPNEQMKRIAGRASIESITLHDTGFMYTMDLLMRRGEMEGKWDLHLAARMEPAVEDFDDPNAGFLFAVASDSEISRR